MSRHIGHLPPGEELTDPESFFALHSAAVSASPAVAAPPATRPVRVPELPEISARPGWRQGALPMRSAPPTRGETRRRAPRLPSSPAAVAALEAEIDRCANREHVARLAVHLAHAYAMTAALFVVYQGLIERVGNDGSPGGGEGLLFPADAPSLFAQVVAGGEPFRGVPPQGALDRRIFRALGRQHIQEMVLLPVAIRGRVVNLLYADNGPEALGDASVAALVAVCERLSGAYERLILERKRR